MKENIHPDYQEVLFVDSATGHKFVCGSTLKPNETQTFEGKKYPVHVVSVSSASHPFFTGSQQFIDTEGRVDKFTKKYAKKKADSEKELERLKQDKESAKKVGRKKKKTS